MVRNNLGKLTPRELDVLGLVAQGFVYRDIGRTLGIAEYTARNHMLSVEQKLGAHTAPHAVAIAKDRGIIKSKRRRHPQGSSLLGNNG